MKLSSLLLAVGLWLACDRHAEAQARAPAVIDGTYWWHGTRFFFGDGKYGPASILEAGAVHAVAVRLTATGSGAVLELPECARVSLRRDGATGRVFVGTKIKCELSETQRRLGVREHTLEAVRLDLAQGTMHYRFCEVGSGGSGCARDDASFTAIPEGATQARPAKGWAFVKRASMLWVCDVPSADQAGCVRGPMAMSRQLTGLYGTLRQLPAGRYHLEGLDCIAPSAEYTGEPVRCGTSLDGLPDGSTSQLWLTKFVLAGERLQFEGEVRGKDYQYYVRVLAPLVPL